MAPHIPYTLEVCVNITILETISYMRNLVSSKTIGEARSNNEEEEDQ